MWQFVGVLLILGSGTNWKLPLIASLAFTAVVIIVPGVYEYLLSEGQKRAVSAALNRILPGRNSPGAASGWGNNGSTIEAQMNEGLVVGRDSCRDALSSSTSNKDVDVGLPRHRH